MARVAIIGMKGQYNHLILRRVLELGHVGKLYVDMSWLDEYEDYDAIIVGGGPARAPFLESSFLEIFRKFLRRYAGPVLGICLGHQTIAAALGGAARVSEFPEYGPADVEVLVADPLFLGVPRRFRAWMSHNDEVSVLPPGFKRLARSDVCEIQAMGDGRIYGVQFHPEVEHTAYGKLIINNFIALGEK